LVIEAAANEESTHHRINIKLRQLMMLLGETENVWRLDEHVGVVFILLQKLNNVARVLLWDHNLTLQFEVPQTTKFTDY